MRGGGASRGSHFSKMISRGLGGGAGKCSMMILRCRSGTVTRRSIMSGSVGVHSGLGGLSRIISGGGVTGRGACLYITSGGNCSGAGS